MAANTAELMNLPTFELNEAMDHSRLCATMRSDAKKNLPVVEDEKNTASSKELFILEDLYD